MNPRSFVYWLSTDLLLASSVMGLAGGSGACSADSRGPAPAAARTSNASTATATLRQPGEDAAAVVNFWRDAGPSMWFAKVPEFDRRFGERFMALHEAAARGELAGWLATPEGTLALLLLLDQFPRNVFRGTARMYATDALARSMARQALARGHDRGLETDLRLFVYLPFGHSEELADQELSVKLSESLGEPSLTHAKGHRDIVRRFGRFPHRNPILGRPMRPEEQKFLDAGGFAG